MERGADRRAHGAHHGGSDPTAARRHRPRAASSSAASPSPAPSTTPTKLYLAARSQNGNIGYWIMTPLKLRLGETVLIERGWVPRT